MFKNYKSGNPEKWTGRATPSELKPQYWYQAITCIDLEKQVPNEGIAILGYQCDEGVRRNLGRVGAKDGANALRQRLGKVALHTDKQLLDAGDVVVVDEDLESCQQDLSYAIAKLLSSNLFPIVIGGGHDIAYGHFKGIFDFVKSNKNISKIGVINFDAHFDLRPVVDRPNSGTPFYQIIQEMQSEEITVDYLPVGIQSQSNTKALFDIAKAEQIDFIYNIDCDFDTIKTHLAAFVEKNDCIYISIDVDGFSSIYAPGVSAPSPLGFTPQFVMNCLTLLFSSGKVISCDFAELNPKFDIDNHTANLVARLVDFIVHQVKNN